MPDSANHHSAIGNQGSVIVLGMRKNITDTNNIAVKILAISALNAIGLWS
jgi:hypothetical protein